MNVRRAVLGDEPILRTLSLEALTEAPDTQLGRLTMMAVLSEPAEATREHEPERKRMERLCRPHPFGKLRSMRRSGTNQMSATST